MTDVKFDCSYCIGVCCIQPPQLNTKEDLAIALKHNVKLIAANVTNGHIIMLEKVKNEARGLDTCPFLNDDNKCDIYDDRFSVCKAFKCDSMQYEVELVSKVPPELLIHGLITGGENHKVEPIHYTLKEVSDMNITVYSREEILAKVYSVGLEPMIDISRKVLIKIKDKT